MRLRNLSHILREAFDLVKPKATRDDVAVKFNCPDDLHIICDDIEIGQVFINLLNNGVECGPRLQRRRL